MLLAPIDIFRESWQIYKANFKAFFRVLLWPLIPIVLLAIINLIDETTQNKYVNYTVPIYLILIALSFIIGLWANIVLVRLIWSGVTHQTVDKKLFYENSWRDTVPYLWVSIIVGFIVILGTILFIIPGLIFGLWYSLATFVFVIEGSRGYEALKTSRALIEGRFWQVVWRWTIPNIITALITTIIIGIPTLIIGYATQFVGFNPATGTTPWWSTFVSSLGSLLVVPLSVGFGVLIFKTLKDNHRQTEITN